MYSRYGQFSETHLHNGRNETSGSVRAISRQTAKPVKGVGISEYNSAFTSNDTTSRKMGNKMSSPVHSPSGHFRDSSSNFSTTTLNRHRQHFEKPSASSLPSINTVLPDIPRSTSSLLRTNDILHRNSVDSGYQSGGKLNDRTSTSDNSSVSNSLNNQNKNIGRRTCENKVENDIINIDKSYINRDTDIYGENTRIKESQCTKYPKRDYLGDRLSRITLDNKRVTTPEKPMIVSSAAGSSSRGLVGLQNLGNTCFMNSILQCLSHCKPLRDHLLQNDGHSINSKSKMKGKLFSAFSELIKTMWSRKTESVSPHNFKLQIQKFSPRFVGYDQQDSQEFLRFLLDGLHEDLNQARTTRSTRTSDGNIRLSDQELSKHMWKQYTSRENSLVTDLFCGQMISILTCSKCNHRSSTFDPFLDLSLPIPRRPYGATRFDARVTLLDCLRLFTKLEDLDGDEKPKCEKCKVRQKCSKQFKIQRFPKILVLHLKRFSGLGFRSKLQTDVEFPSECLNLDQFASECSGSQSVTYKLFAISNHSGGTYGGHYTAYCRHPESKEWHSFNDSRVSGLLAANVRGPQAYVLFYEREDSTSKY